MATAKPLARLKPVTLRAAWESESADFTPWLAHENNIALLGETIGVELAVEAQEKNVGPFRADILCKDTASQTWVLIENQLEKTDHLHLGQLLTYAAGLQAATIVWVAARFTDEHRAALDWLNEITSDEFSFFGLEVELWQIGDSPAAPKFNVVCKPNDWSRTITSAARSGNGSLSETQQIQLEYWTKLRAHMEEKGGRVNPTKAHPQGYMDFSLGKSGIWLSAWIRVRDKGITVILTIGCKDSLAYFRLLQQNQFEFDERFGQALEWLARPGKKQKLIRISLDDADPLNRDDWDRQHEWIHDKLEKMHVTFADAVKSLDPANYSRDEDE